MESVLVIIPCGQGKVWDADPDRGPTPARVAYTGAPFKVNRAYAERHADRWVILSAKYGFIDPDFRLPEPYNVTFKKRATNPIELLALRRQITPMGLDQFSRIVGLGGKEYRAMIEGAFATSRTAIEFPFAGLPIGLAMQAIKKAMSGDRNSAQVLSRSDTDTGNITMIQVQHRDSVLKAIEEFDRLGRRLFLSRYGFGVAHSYFLVFNGKKYDSKAILGVAYGYEHLSEGPLSSQGLCGGRGVQRRLEELGFEVLVED